MLLQQLYIETKLYSLFPFWSKIFDSVLKMHMEGMITSCIKSEVGEGAAADHKSNSLAEILVPRPSPRSINECRNVVIVMDALREFSLEPLLWTLANVVTPACSVIITLLGVMPWIPLACKIADLRIN